MGLADKFFLLRHRVSGTQLGSPLAVVGIANVLVMVVGTVTSFVLVRILTKENYGHLIYFYTCVALLRLFMSLGLMANMGRDVSVAWNNRPQLMTIVYSNAVMRVIAMVVVSLIALTVAEIMNQPFWEYIALGAIAASTADFFQSIIASSRQTRPLVFMTVSQPIVYLVLGLLLAVVGNVTSEMLMLMYIASFLCMALLGLYLVINTGQIGRPTLASINFRYLRGNLSFTLVAFMTGFFTQVWSTITLGVLGWMSLFQASAEFSVIFTTVNLPVSVISPALLTTFYPQMAVLFSQNQPEKTRAYVQNVLNLVVMFAIWVGVLLLAFPETIILTLFGASYLVSTPYLMRFAVLPILLSSAPVFTLSMVASKRPSRALYGGGIQVLVLVIMIALSPSLSIDALSWAVIVSCAASLAIQWGLMSVTLKTAIIPSGITRILITAVGATLLLKFASSGLAASLSIWHILLGLVFTVIYWFVALVPLRMPFRRVA